MKKLEQPKIGFLTGLTLTLVACVVLYECTLVPYEAGVEDGCHTCMNIPPKEAKWSKP